MPFTAGTGIDILARIFGDELQQRWGQTVTVENRPGASGNIGSQYAATRPPDGHTIMMTVNTFVMNVSLFKSVPYDPQEELCSHCRGRHRFAGACRASLDRSRDGECAGGAGQSQSWQDASPGRGTPQHLAMLAPAETPSAIIDRYNRVLNDILSTPKVRDALAVQGLSARGGSPADLAQLIASDQIRWAKLVKGAGIAPAE